MACSSLVGSATCASWVRFMAMSRDEIEGVGCAKSTAGFLVTLKIGKLLYLKYTIHRVIDFAVL